MTKKSLRITKAVLVYQGGIANVFSVQNFSEQPEQPDARYAIRLMQHAFEPCAYYAKGLQAAGVEVRTAVCNEAGDIINRPWSNDYDLAPFSDKFVLVGGVL